MFLGGVDSQITSQLFDFTWRHWYSDTEVIIPAFTTILHTGANGAPPLSAESQQAFALTCDRWLLCTRTLRRMLIYGYASDFKSVQVGGSQGAGSFRAPRLDSVKFGMCGALTFLWYNIWS